MFDFLKRKKTTSTPSNKKSTELTMSERQREWDRKLEREHDKAIKEDVEAAKTEPMVYYKKTTAVTVSKSDEARRIARMKKIKERDAQLLGELREVDRKVTNAVKGIGKFTKVMGKDVGKAAKVAGKGLKKTGKKTVNGILDMGGNYTRNNDRAMRTHDEYGYPLKKKAKSINKKPTTRRNVHVSDDDYGYPVTRTRAIPKRRPVSDDDYDYYQPPTKRRAPTINRPQTRKATKHKGNKRAKKPNTDWFL